MKTIKTLILSLCFLAIQNSFALPSGAYLGVHLGETNTHFNAAITGIKNGDIRNFSFNGRAFLGHQWTDILATEFGYLPIRRIRLVNINQSLQNGKIKQHSIDFTARLNWHFAKDLDVIGRFGASYLIAIPDTIVRRFSTNDYSKNRVAHYRPLIGGALNYKAGAFPLALEISWIHMLEHRALSAVDFVAAGVVLYSSGT